MPQVSSLDFLVTPIGEDEVKEGRITIKDMKKGTSIRIACEELDAYVRNAE